MAALASCGVKLRVQKGDTRNSVLRHGVEHNPARDAVVVSSADQLRLQRFTICEELGKRG
jgi:hypothetical protein